MEKKTTIAAVAVVIIVIVAAVAAYFVMNDSSDDSGSDSGDDGSDTGATTYYIYIDGFGDDVKGWYTVQADSADAAAVAAFTEAGLTASYSGWSLTVEGFEGSYDSETGTGTGNGIYEYISTDTSSYVTSDYFVAGPSLANCVSNIIYVVYADYYFDADDNYATVYSINPSNSTDWSTTGPFAA